MGFENAKLLVFSYCIGVVREDVMWLLHNAYITRRGNNVN